MLEITLDLVEEGPRFTPRIGCTENGKGLRDISNNWVSSFFQVATLFKRLDCDGTYMREMHTDPDVCLLMAVIEDTQDTNERMLLELRGQFDELSFLWTTDREVFFKDFTADALVLTQRPFLMFSELQLRFDGVWERRRASTPSPRRGRRFSPHESGFVTPSVDTGRDRARDVLGSREV